MEHSTPTPASNANLMVFAGNSYIYYSDFVEDEMGWVLVGAPGSDNSWYWRGYNDSYSPRADSVIETNSNLAGDELEEDSLYLDSQLTGPPDTYRRYENENDSESESDNGSDSGSESDQENYDQHRSRLDSDSSLPAIYPITLQIRSSYPDDSSDSDNDSDSEDIVFVAPDNQSGKLDLCKICYEEFEDGFDLSEPDTCVRSHICRHAFHKGCLQHYINNTTGLRILCPDCRRPFGER